MRISSIINKANLHFFKQSLLDKGIYACIYRSLSALQEHMKYPKWFASQQPSPATIQKQKNHLFSLSPLISIVVPTYCTPIPFLKELISSLIDQTYENWELCIADASPIDSEVRVALNMYQKMDKRIKVEYLNENLGISGNTNKALKLTSGSYIALLDHDDKLAINCLFEIVQAINKDPSIDILYTDEDKIDAETGTHYYPNFKPDYNPILLRTCNYITHFFVFKRTIFEKVGLFNEHCEGSQDYDYILRTTSIAKNVHHIPKILYHWRVHKGSVAGNVNQKNYCYTAALRALQDDLKRGNIKGVVRQHKHLTGYYTIHPQIPSKAKILLVLLNSSKQKLDFQNSKYNINQVTVNNYKEMHKCIMSTSSDYIILLNGIISTISEKDIIKTISCLKFQDIGAVVYKLAVKNKIHSLGNTYQNNKICGCYNSIPLKDYGYRCRAFVNQCVPFCTVEAFATKSELYKKFLITNKTLNYTPLDIVVMFSLYLSSNNKYIVGIPDVFLHVKPSEYSELSSSVIDMYKNEIKSSSRLYSIPPYYKKY